MIKETQSRTETELLSQSNSLKSSLSPDDAARNAGETGAVAGFAQVLNAVTAQASKPTQLAATSANDVSSSPSLRFVSSVATSTNPGENTARLSADSVNGHAAIGAAKVQDRWETTEAKREQAEVSVPGGRLKDGDDDEDRETRGTIRKATTGKGVEMRNVTTRANGTPLVRDANGTARVLGAADAENGLASYIKEEAGTERGEAAIKALASAKAKAKKTDAQFVETERAVRTKLTEGAGVSAKQGLTAEAGNLTAVDEKTAKETKSEAATPTPTATAQDVSHPKVTAAAEGSARNGRDKDAAASDEKGHPLAAETAKRVESFDTALKGVKAAANPTTSLVQTIEAHDVAGALHRNDTVLASSRMAQLLNARVELLANGNEKNLTLTLNPQELGEIRMQLVSQGDRTDLVMKAERDPVATTLQNAVPELAKLLEKSGVQVGRISVEYSMADFSGQSGQGQSSSQREAEPVFTESATSNRGAASAAITTGNASTASPLHDGTLNIVA